jgi:hypothetical protein
MPLVVATVDEIRNPFHEVYSRNDLDEFLTYFELPFYSTQFLEYHSMGFLTTFAL